MNSDLKEAQAKELSSPKKAERSGEGKRSYDRNPELIRRYRDGDTLAGEVLVRVSERLNKRTSFI